MSQKESLVAIFQRLYIKYAEKQGEPDPNENGFFEMKKAANEYASSLLSLGNQWINAVVYDIERLNNYNSTPPSLRFNKERLRKYKGIASFFLCDIKESLRHHGFDIMELPKETLAYMQEEAFVFDKQTGKYKPIHPKDYEKIKQQRKAARKNTATTATDGSIQAAPAGISKQPQHLPPMEAADIMPDTPSESIFTDCIANDYRGNTAIIEKELKKALQGKKAKAAIIVFVTCFYHGILRKCPSHQQALYLSKSIGENHKGYNDQKEIYFTQSEEGKRGNGNFAIYDTLKTENIDIIRESMITTEAKLKPLFGTLGIVITPDTSPSTNSLPPI